MCLTKSYILNFFILKTNTGSCIESLVVVSNYTLIMAMNCDIILRVRKPFIFILWYRLITSITIILSRQLIYNSTVGLVKYLFSRQNNSNIGSLEIQ